MIPGNPDNIERLNFSKNFQTAFRAFFTSLTLVQNVKVIIPTLVYMFLQLAIMTLYLLSIERPWTSFWALFAGGVAAGDLAHFPRHLLLMQQVLGRVDMLVDTFVHVVFQAATVSLVSAAFRKKTVSLSASMKESCGRYFKLVFVSLLSAVLVYSAINLARHLSGNMDGIVRAGVAASGVLAGLVVQVFFLFSIPIIMHANPPVARIVPDSLRMALKLPLASAFIVAVSFVITLPTTFLSLKAGMIALQLSPDFMIHSHIASMIMELTAAYLLTAGATIIFIHKMEAVSK